MSSSDPSCTVSCCQDIRSIRLPNDMRLNAIFPVMKDDFSIKAAMKSSTRAFGQHSFTDNQL